MFDTSTDSLKSLFLIYFDKLYLCGAARLSDTEFPVNTMAMLCDINGDTGKATDKHIENIPFPAGTSVYEYEYFNPHFCKPCPFKV